jgi:hypothetical protein
VSIPLREHSLTRLVGLLGSGPAEAAHFSGQTLRDLAVTWGHLLLASTIATPEADLEKPRVLLSVVDVSDNASLIG